MKRGIWLLVLGVVVLGIAAGLAIGGRPETPSDLLITEPPSSTTTLETVEPVGPDSSVLDNTSSQAVEKTLRNLTIVVVANASGESGLASRVATRLVDVGWAAVDPADALVTDSVSRVYFAERFEDAARLVGADLGLVDAEYSVLPDRALTVDGSTGDVVVLLGADPVS